MKFYFSCSQNYDLKLCREYGIKNIFINFRDITYGKIDPNEIYGFDSVIIFQGKKPGHVAFNKFLEEHGDKFEYWIYTDLRWAEGKKSLVYNRFSGLEQLKEKEIGGIYIDDDEKYKKNRSLLRSNIRKTGYQPYILLKTHNLTRFKSVDGIVVATPFHYSNYKKVAFFDIIKGKLVKKKPGEVTKNDLVKYVGHDWYEKFDYDKIHEGVWAELRKINLYTYKLYVDYIRGIIRKKKEYEIVKEYYEKAGVKMPDWVDEEDAYGEKKIKYLRKPRGKTMIYSRMARTFSLLCDNCLVADRCPMYEENSVCQLLPLMRQFGNTRNVEHILKKMEEIIADEYYRYMRGSYFEDMMGGEINKEVTKLGDTLVKHLELYAKLKFGKDNQVNINNLIYTDQVNITWEEALEKVRKEYGDDLAEKIKKRIEQEGE